MSIKIFNLAYDDVISSYVGLGMTNYRYALEKVYPLIDRFEAQRKILDVKFYERLERDILKGCLMPPITLAFVGEQIELKETEDIEEYVKENIVNGYILDGIQRLTTLHRAKGKDKFDSEKALFFNIIVANNKDKLLYRMITLNNGQKGMTPRHQIEILTQELFDFKNLPNIKVQTEKEKSETPIKNAYSMGDISKGYTAFLTGSVNNENSKIIESKMDEILVGKILDVDLSTYGLQFTEVINFIDAASQNAVTQKWLQVTNNFIGFCVGIRKSFEYIFGLPLERLELAFDNFEIAFKAIDASKINLGKYRRLLSSYYVENAEHLFNQNSEFLIECFAEKTLSE